MAQLTGVHGRIAWGYHTAETIQGYTVTATKTEAVMAWRLSAVVVQADPYQLQQRPLEFLAGPSEAWRWPVLSVTLSQGRLSATLGAPVDLPLRDGRE